MLTHMEVFSSRPGLPLLPLAAGGIEDDAIQIRNITGLEPVKATVNTTPFSSSDGEYFNSNIVGKRNIVLTLGFNPDWAEQSIESLRELLYDYFMPKSNVVFKFFGTLRPTCVIEGWVESCTPILFTKNPEVQISIICPQPDFVDYVGDYIEGAVVAGSDVAEGVLPIDEGTEFEYLGSVPTSFKLTIRSSVDNPSYTGPLLVGIISDTTEKIQFAVVMDSTDEIEYSTFVGQKHLEMHSDPDVVTNLLSTVVGSPKWPKLKRGTNTIVVAGTEAGQQWTLEFYNRYGGL